MTKESIGEFVNIDELKEWDENPRVNDHAVKDVASSIKRFGFASPIIARKENGEIIAGHTRYKAAKELGLDRVPVRYVDLDPVDSKLLAIADNKIAEKAEWENDSLGRILRDLDEQGIDISITGFSDEDLENLFPPEPVEGLTDPDEIPEAPEEPTVQRGEIWQLGEHRVMCGDSTSAEDVAMLMNGEKADMVFTDPPYGVSVVKGGMVGANFGVAAKGKYAEVIGDESTESAVQALALCQEMEIKTLIFWGGNYYADKLPPVSSWIVWDKRVESGIVNTFADCEIAWANTGGPARIYRQLWNGMIREGESSKRVHPTQKPVALAVWSFENYGNPKSVIDLFLGSGTTLIACEQTNRKCYGMEMSPNYCDVIIERWEDFTGKKAELIKTAS